MVNKNNNFVGVKFNPVGPQFFKYIVRNGVLQTQHVTI